MSKIAPRKKVQKAKALTGKQRPKRPRTPNGTPPRPSDETWPPSNIDVDLGIISLPEELDYGATGLHHTQRRLLAEKKSLLQQCDALPPGLNIDRKTAQSVVDATLIFAQKGCGTAVCVAREGLLLTCAHCIAETAEDFSVEKTHWLLFASGQVVKTMCVAWDPKRDLALLRVVAAQPSPADDIERPGWVFPSISLAEAMPKLAAGLLCIGHPGSEDLEAGRAGVKTNYDVLHVSLGKYRGLAEGQDVQDNSEIGALMHDCWTYWGHSGAPLVERRSGKLIGLHSSWDDTTAMRRGVPLEALREFLDETGLLRALLGNA